MRHSFLVEVARIVGAEPAILESEFCYIAENYGVQGDEGTEFSVSLERLEDKFSYFRIDVESCIWVLNARGPFKIDIDDGIVHVEVRNSWLNGRGE